MNHNIIAGWTIFRREVVRLKSVWKSTILAPIISTSLYFIIFGSFIGSRIGEMEGVPYMHFIIPGLIMMPAITGSYMQTCFALFLQRWSRSMEDILVSPTGRIWILLGFSLSGVVRGLVISSLVLVVSMLFAPLKIYNIGFMILFMVLTSFFFSLVGFAASLHAKSFDDNNIIPTFGLTPLTYLGGVFYSVSVLPEFWQSVSKLNPILYMVNGFRYGFLGTTDVSIPFSIGLLLFFITVMIFLNLHFMKKGVGLRT